MLEGERQKRKITERFSVDEAPETIASDPASPELTEADFAVMRPFAEVFPDLAERMKKGVIRLPRKV